MSETSDSGAWRLHADLSWYDYPSSAPALDAFWAVVRDHLRDRGIEAAPEHLDRSVSPRDLWGDPRCLLSQCCGPDLFTPQGARLQPLARPVFVDIQASAGSYFSHVVAPVEERAAAGCVAVNAPSSRSGCLALYAWLEARGEPAPPMLVSGAHAASLELLRRGEADLAAIDAHNWPLLDQRGVRIVGRTDEAPSPPWVCHEACGVAPALLRQALQRAIEDRGAAIGISGLRPAHRDDWRRLVAAARDARALPGSDGPRAAPAERSA